VVSISPFQYQHKNTMDGPSHQASISHPHPKKSTNRVNKHNHFPPSHYTAAHSSSPLPFKFINPTTLYHPITLESESAIPHPEEDQPQNTPPPPPPTKKVYHVWRSRDNRKGRHAAVVVREGVAGKGEGEGDGKGETESILTPTATNTISETCKGIAKMVVRWPVWDVSFDVAVVFTFGELPIYLGIYITWWLFGTLLKYRTKCCCNGFMNPLLTTPG